MSEATLRTASVLFLVLFVACIADRFFPHPSTIVLYWTIGTGAFVLAGMLMRWRRRRASRRS